MVWVRGKGWGLGSGKALGLGLRLGLGVWVRGRFGVRARALAWVRVWGLGPGLNHDWSCAETTIGESHRATCYAVVVKFAYRYFRIKTDITGDLKGLG